MLYSVDDYRYDTFIELGFTEDQALELVDAHGLDGFRLSHHDVRRYLEQGATHALVVCMFT